MRQRGGWLPETLFVVGGMLVVLAAMGTAARHFGERLLDGRPHACDWPVAIGALALGSMLTWLMRR